MDLEKDGIGTHFCVNLKRSCTYLMLDRTMDRSSLLKILISLFKFFVIFGMEPLITSNIDYLWMRLNVLLKILPNALLLILLKQELLYWSIPAPFTVECLYLKGTRYALTNYYYPENEINSAMFEKFNVLKDVNYKKIS